MMIDQSQTLEEGRKFAISELIIKFSRTKEAMSGVVNAADKRKRAPFSESDGRCEDRGSMMAANPLGFCTNEAQDHFVIS